MKRFEYLRLFVTVNPDDEVDDEPFYENGVYTQTILWDDFSDLQRVSGLGYEGWEMINWTPNCGPNATEELIWFKREIEAEKPKAGAIEL